ncbi:MAG TPA: ECF transporter S component [Candidatus Limousia pullorum]|uniref:ECF transporter S component n=1 Tax=Candidatus Limousia pullorum TaxID=2840860 RepID=A0A9D1S7A3_9FIRM|nr:ECF transporter S component [Candidatus Limousia pullorum]
MSKKEKQIPLKSVMGLAVFALIIVVMAFTPAGFLKTGNLEASFLVVPVAIGAILLGPTNGAVLGLVMGVVSFAQCFGASDMGSALFGVSAINTFLLCVIPRVICGWMAGVFYDLLSKIDKTGFVPQIAAAVVCPLFNFILFMLGLSLLFGQTPYLLNLQTQMNASGIGFYFALGGMNLLYELLASLVLTTGISTLILKFKNRNKVKEEVSKKDKK